MKTILTFFFAFTLLLLPLSKVKAQDTLNEPVKAEVIQVIEEREINENNVKGLYQILSVKILEGDEKDKTVEVENNSYLSARVLDFSEGDNVYLLKGNIAGTETYSITDYVRTPSLYVLLALFAIVTLLITGKKGIYSLLGLGVTFLILFSYVLPQLNKGNDPILVAISGSMIIIFVSFYLTHGFNKKTSIAVAGTLITLLLVGIFSVIYIDIAKLTGLASEDAFLLSSMSSSLINIKGLLLASIIIGMVGILDDITISQVSVAIELKKANGALNFKELYKRSMNIGRDHIASVVNTLIVVYTSASLPLLLLFINSEHSFSYLLNVEVVSEEVVRTLISSIGLIGAVPITTLLAAYLISKPKFAKSLETIESYKHQGHSH